METYCLLEKLKETIQSDFRGEKAHFTCALALKVIFLRDSFQQFHSFFYFYFVERICLKIYFKMFDNI